MASWATGSQVLRDQEVLVTIASYTSQEVEDVSARTTPPEALQGEGSQPLAPTQSADPELWAAIYASLEEQSKQQRRQLCRHLSDASPEVAARLRTHRAEAARTSAEGVTYFEGTAVAGGQGQGQDTGLVLPSFAGYPPAVRAAVLAQICNERLRNEAEQDGVINCIPGCTQQLVLTTLGDGNCLSHSASMGVWGVHDRDGRLRSAIHATMAHPVAGCRIRERFESQLASIGIPQESWAAEWERELSTFGSTGTYLSDVHCYTLANVLRRPVIIFGDEQAAAAGLAGIYLPSLWPAPDVDCSRQPLAVLFGWSHFSLLATVQGEGPASPPLLPLCTRLGPLPLRFLSAAEEQQVACSSSSSSSGSEQQLALLQQYMDAELLFNGSLGVRLSEDPRPHVLVTLLGSIYLRQAAEQQAQLDQQQQQQPKHTW